MEIAKTNLNKVWISFAIYLIGYFAIMIIFKDQSLAWLELEAFSLIVSIAMLKKHSFPNRKGIIISVIVTILYVVSKITTFNVFAIIQTLILFLAASACCRPWSPPQGAQP